MKNGCALENEVDYPNVFFYHDDSEEMYVGGTNYVSKLNVNDYNTIEVCGKSELLYVCVCVYAFVVCSVRLAAAGRPMLWLVIMRCCNRV